MLTRRHFIQTTAALFSAPIASPALAAYISDQSRWDEWDALVTPANYDPATSNPWGLQPRFLPVRVEAKPGLTPGDIHVDAVARYLYHVRDDGTAMRYGVRLRAAISMRRAPIPSAARPNGPVGRRPLP